MAASPSRKLAVILHADVVGSTTLVQKDESTAHERVQAAFQRLSNTTGDYGGTAHEIRGDALVAEFSRASDGVCAALAFQAENIEHNRNLSDDIRPEIRVGISLGEVVVADGTVTGAGVILAQRLEQLAEPHGVVVQGSVSETVPTRLPLEFESLGEQALKGFDQPVRAFIVRQKTGAVIPGPDSAIATTGPGDVTADTVQERSSLEFSDKPSIAVLPFENMSGDPEQEYFSDGITEDIITELSRFPTLFVIARHSSFTFKGHTVDVKDVGKKLGVRYVVEGSVRKAGYRIRVTAQLIEAATGSHVWAERYDRKIEDIFDVQDEVTHAIVSTLPGQLERAVAERAERKRTEDMTAYECLLRGNRLFYRFTRDDVLEARRLYQRAATLDPKFAQAYSRLAASYNVAAIRGYEPDNTWEETMKAAQQALALDSNDGWTRLALGWTLMRRGRFDEAEEQFHRSLALNPSDADTVVFIANAFVCLGRAEEAFDLFHKAVRLNPLHPDVYHAIQGHAAYFTGQFDDARRGYRQGGTPDRWRRAVLIAACGQLGRTDEARREGVKLVQERREWLAKSGRDVPSGGLERDTAWVTRYYRRQQERDLLLDGLRKAGMLE